MPNNLITYLMNLTEAITRKERREMKKLKSKMRK